MNDFVPRWYNQVSELTSYTNKLLKNSLQQKIFRDQFGETLCGTCAIGSRWLRNQLAPIGARFCVGEHTMPLYSRDGNKWYCTSQHISAHCWVEIDQYIIDPTFTQFHPIEDIKICDSNTVFGNRYKKIAEGNAAFKQLRKWSYQNPELWVLDRNKRMFVPRQKSNLKIYETPRCL